MQEKEDLSNKSDRTKIYFLVVAIVALLGTNAYFYFKDKQQDERFATVSTEKDKLELDVEKIEVELDKITAVNVNLNEQLQDEQRLAREKIAEIKMLLQRDQLTQGDLKKAQNEIEKLREFVKNYNSQLSNLEKENTLLKSERDSLQQSINSAAEKAEDLEQRNSSLNARVKIGAALKTSNITITPYRIKSNGKNSEVTKASSTEKFNIRFNIVPNQLAAKDYHNVYLRVFDPAGNLIANNNNLFEAEEQQMQYTTAITISYNNDETIYNIDWANPNTYMKGTYSFILYANGYTMGKTQYTLK